jgi:hypothetical protein
LRTGGGRCAAEGSDHLELIRKADERVQRDI